jgi:hypothetical protein
MLGFGLFLACGRASGHACVSPAAACMGAMHAIALLGCFFWLFFLNKKNERTGLTCLLPCSSPGRKSLNEHLLAN